MTTIACPSCAASYDVEPARFPAAEVRAGCLSCGRELFLRVRERADGRAARASAPAPAPASAPESDLASAPAPDLASAPAVQADRIPGPGASWTPAAERETEPDTAAAPGFPEAPSREADVAAGGPAAAADAAADGFSGADAGLRREWAGEPGAGAGDRAAMREPEPSEPGPAQARPGSEGFTFAQVGDVASRARRLARALVSDIVVYHPRKVEEGRREGSLREILREEVDKSWEEYCERLGPDVARAHRPAFVAALNAILARDQPVF
jgi:predicted  nucleic acid-binding Zn-ribbon protein